MIRYKRSHRECSCPLTIFELNQIAALLLHKMASENVTKLTVVGRVECARESTEQALFVTIANDLRPDSQTIRLLTTQSTEQRWCLVRTPSMGERFIICSYPTTNMVLQTTKDQIDTCGVACRIKVVKLPSNIVLGSPLPTSLDKTFQFRYEENPNDNGKMGYYLISEAGMSSDSVMHGGYSVKGIAQEPPKLKDHVSIHVRERISRELFWFENPPTRK